MPESDLYPPLRTFLETNGYAVEEQLTVYSQLSGNRRDIDLAGFKWAVDGGLDAWVVEAKIGTSPTQVLGGLPQGIEYQLFSPRVSIAAEANRKEIGFAEQPLRSLGLGYICAQKNAVNEIIQPSSSPRLYRDEFQRVLRHVGFLRLLADGLSKELGESLRSHSWVDNERSHFCVHTNDHKVQIQLITYDDEFKDTVVAMVWVEAKPYLTNLVSRIADEPDKLKETLLRYDLKGFWQDHRRDNLGSLESPKVRRPVSADKLIEDVKWAKKVLAEPRRIPCMAWRIPLWALSAAPSRQQAEESLQTALKKLIPLRKCLQSLAG